jgi:ribonuclease P protein subunit RPR2
MPRKPETQIKIAKERIEILFKEAESVVSKRPDLAKRYIKLAKKIGMRYNVRLGEFKRRFCKYCYSFLLPGVTCSQRLRNGRITIKCFSCNKTIHYPYKIKKSK